MTEMRTLNELIKIQQACDLEILARSLKVDAVTLKVTKNSRLLLQTIKQDKKGCTFVAADRVLRFNLRVSCRKYKTTHTSCTCNDFIYRKRQCKHILFVKQNTLLVNQPTPTPTPTKINPNRPILKSKTKLPHVNLEPMIHVSKSDKVFVTKYEALITFAYREKNHKTIQTTNLGKIFTWGKGEKENYECLEVLAMNGETKLIRYLDESSVTEALIFLLRNTIEKYEGIKETALEDAVKISENHLVRIAAERALASIM